MKRRLALFPLGFVLVLVWVVVVVVQVSGVTTPIQIVSAKKISGNSTILPGPLALGTEVARIKREYHGGRHTGIAYKRVNDAGHKRTVGSGHRPHGEGHGEHRNSVGEDGTHINDFKSYGVGYEHRHSDHCEESKCGYNIRHCPHGCVFNSFLCGDGAAYDTCCC